MTHRELRAVQYGLGAIGGGVVRIASRKQGMRIVGCVDVNPELMGKDAGEAAGLNARLGVPVVASLSELQQSASRDAKGKLADVAFHCTGSHLTDVRGQLAELIEAGMNVVSTCEELSFPRARHPQCTADLDALAKQHGVTVLGTGINPGFIMDTLPVALTAMCADVRRVRVRRVLDVSTRRRQLQAKVGTGMTVDEFQRRAATGRMGHIGLRESLLGIAEALGWPTESLHHSLEPVVAEVELTTQFFDIPPGRVAGLRERTWLERDGEEVLALDLEMSVGASDPRDTVEIEGTPPIKVRVDGVHGDIGTLAVVVNSARRVVDAPPGLLTMLDLPLVWQTPERPRA